MSKHTPGPWKIRKNAENMVILPANNLCAIGVVNTKGEFCDCTEENARLIAAAPELLEGAKKALGFLYSSMSPEMFEEWAAALELAVKKAEGT